ncbi:sugar-binding transcriptional regulator [Aestuariivirga sp.]|uniref:sugar-binding transcriptional regulator n=1 Tax=Aestuariivirga sp. TaxID=2650926 RepID=UPI0039E633D1
MQITITGRLAECVELETRLCQRFGLQEAIVVPTPPDPAFIPHVIGTAAGAALTQRLKDGLSVGVGWGRTLRLSLHSVPRRSLPHLSVVSMMGGLTRGAAMNPHETASHLADLLDAQCFYVAAPTLTDTETTRDVLMAQPMLREVFERAANVDLALVSVGELTYTNTMSRVGLVTRKDVDELRLAGAVGDICARWIDVNGRVVDHPLNARVVALDLERLSRIPCVMLASGGRPKAEAMLGAMKGGMVHVAVTDEQTARSDSGTGGERQWLIASSASISAPPASASPPLPSATSC